MKAHPDFPERLVLAEGYPWPLGVDAPHRELCMSENPVGLKPVPLQWDTSLWDKRAPRYRLVLERITVETPPRVMLSDAATEVLTRACKGTCFTGERGDIEDELIAAGFAARHPTSRWICTITQQGRDWVNSFKSPT